MKNIFKNKQGFTLIELLVVIGILAVLAAIAIPSVAGLIDRANKSADNSNANEMTNAVERFVSEYELYKQDIASGTFDKTDLDSAQGRVYNVTGIENREQVTKFESTKGLSGKGVDLDSKYPVNEETFKSVVQNYMKTSSSTFEPKQSDCQYWYSPECGRVIVAEVGSKASELTAIGFDDASINTVLDTTEQYDEIHWICLDAETTNHIADEQGQLVKWDVSVKPVEIIDFVLYVETTSFNYEPFNFQCEKGMTWNEWVTSEYTDGKVTLSSNDIDFRFNIEGIRGSRQVRIDLFDNVYIYLDSLDTYVSDVEMDGNFVILPLQYTCPSVYAGGWGSHRMSTGDRYVIYNDLTNPDVEILEY